MDKITLKSLKGSIKKWTKIRDGKGKDKGAANCPLCLSFNNNDLNTVPCIGCPVHDIGCDGCDNTPHEEWLDHYEDKHFRIGKFPEVKCKTCKRLAQKEIDFLISLLPKGKK